MGHRVYSRRTATDDDRREARHICISRFSTPMKGRRSELTEEKREAVTADVNKQAIELDLNRQRKRL